MKNNYQKVMDHITLDESRKEEILQNVLRKDIRPIRPMFRFAIPALTVLVLAVFAGAIKPSLYSAKTANDSAAPAMIATEESYAEAAAVEEEADMDTCMEATEVLRMDEIWLLDHIPYTVEAIIYGDCDERSAQMTLCLSEGELDILCTVDENRLPDDNQIIHDGYRYTLTSTNITRETMTEILNMLKANEE